MHALFVSGPLLCEVHPVTACSGHLFDAKIGTPLAIGSYFKPDPLCSIDEILLVFESFLAFWPKRMS